MSLEVKLVLLEPADVELLARSAALELASDVFLVVAYDPMSNYQHLAICTVRSRMGILTL